MMNRNIVRSLLKFADRIVTGQHQVLEQAIRFAHGRGGRVDEVSLGPFPVVGKSVLFVCGEATYVQFADTFLALGQRCLSLALIAVLIHGTLVFRPELLTQVFRTPASQIKKNADRDRYYSDGKN